jgi:hypothetical protein
LELSRFWLAATKQMMSMPGDEDLTAPFYCKAFTVIMIGTVTLALLLN